MIEKQKLKNELGILVELREVITLQDKVKFSKSSIISLIKSFENEIKKELEEKNE